MPFVAIVFESGRAYVDFEGVFGTTSDGIGAVVLDEASSGSRIAFIELEISDSNELILFHVSEEREEDDEDPNVPAPSTKSFDADCDCEGVCVKLMRVGVLGAVLVPNGEVVAALVEDGGVVAILVGEDGRIWCLEWETFPFKEAGGDSSMR